MISLSAARYKKGTASAWMLFFFAYEVQTPNHLRAAPAGRMGSRRTKQTTPHTFPRDPVVTSPTSATISRSQKRYHGFEPPKSHDFGGFSRVCSLFRNHEVCGYRVQKKRYHFKKTASRRMSNSFRLRRKRSPHF